MLYGVSDRLSGEFVREPSAFVPCIHERRRVRYECNTINRDVEVREVKIDCVVDERVESCS